MTDISAAGSLVSAIAKSIFYLHSPLSKQLLRDVDSIAVAVAPTPQL